MCSTFKSGVSKSRYISISILTKKLPILVHFTKNSDVISLVIDQSQPGVFYLQKMMNFMKPGVFYLQKMMNFMKPGSFTFKKIMNFMKMRTSYKKLPLFTKNSILHTYKKTQTSNMSFTKNSIFGTFRDPCSKDEQFMLSLYLSLHTQLTVYIKLVYLNWIG